MRYLDKKFSVASPDSDAYRDGWDRVFGKKASEFCEECASSGSLVKHDDIPPEYCAEFIEEDWETP